jgi:hypothetical protein
VRVFTKNGASPPASPDVPFRPRADPLLYAPCETRDAMFLCPRLAALPSCIGFADRALRFLFFPGLFFRFYRPPRAPEGDLGLWPLLRFLLVANGRCWDLLLSNGPRSLQNPQS